MSELIERLEAASRDDRLADGMLYREAAARLREQDARIAELESEVAKRNHRISQLTAELKHCSVFIRTREKMHPSGIELFDRLLGEHTNGQ
jgi:hypothetical protein